MKWIRIIMKNNNDTDNCENNNQQTKGQRTCFNSPIFSFGRPINSSSRVSNAHCRSSTLGSQSNCLVNVAAQHTWGRWNQDQPLILQRFLTYCWWQPEIRRENQKSGSEHPIIYRVSHASGGCLGFRPSTVSQYLSPVRSKSMNA